MTTETTANNRLGMNTATETARRLDEISALLQAQQAQIEAQRTQIETLSTRAKEPVQPRRQDQEQHPAKSGGQRTAPERPQPSVSLVRSATRRDLLRLGGAAVGAAGLAAVAGIQRPLTAEAASNPLNGTAINSTDGETVIQASNAYSGNFELLLLDATNSQSNPYLRGLRVQGSGSAPGISSVGGAANGLGVSGAGQGSGSGVAGSGGPSNGSGVLGLGGGSGAGMLGLGAGYPGGGVGLTYGGSPGVVGLGGTAPAAGGIFAGNGAGPGVSAVGGGTSAPGVTATGGSPNGFGVDATGAGSAAGVRGKGGGASGSGVYGEGGNTNGLGVVGQGFGTGVGVSGVGGNVDAAGGSFQGWPASAGHGVVGQGGSNGGNGAQLTGGGTAAPLNLAPSGTPGPPGSGAHARGDVMVDSNGIMWVCVAQGTPGTFVPLQPGQGTTAGTNVFYRAAITTQPTLLSSDGSAWTDMNAGLILTITPAFKCLAVLTGNCDLWTDTAGYNQDLGITVSGGVYPTTASQPEAWKESGGFAGTFSPNAAYVQTAVPLLAGTAYTIKLQWKTNKNAPGATIVAGAGPIGGKFSPTSLLASLIPTV